MATRFWQEELECMPLSRIAAFHNERLRQSGLVTRAYDSALYKTAWQNAGLSPDSISTRTDLRRVPYLTGRSLRDAFAAHAVNDILTSHNVRFWFCTSGTTGAPKWIPYTDGDISLCEQIMMRCIWLCEADRTRLTWLSLITPAPFVADGSSYIGMFAEMLARLENEHILALATDVDVSLPLARAREPNILFAFPSIAVRIAERLSEAAMNERERQSPDEVDLSNSNRIMIRDIIGFKYGLFSGEALAPYRQAIIENYGLEPFELYTCTEFLCFNVECRHHCGIHLWLDACIAEVIPQSELDKEENTPGYVPRARFLDEVPVGTVGEYVMTTFGEALPLVRYRTSDLLEVVGTDRCLCGRTHPRVKVMRRLDDVVNMGLIRFSILEVEACLESVSRSGKVVNWQLRLDREGYKPKPVLFVEATRSAADQELVDEIRSKIFEIEVLLVGCQRGIVADPEIRLVAKIDEVRTATGKVRKIVYGEKW